MNEPLCRECGNPCWIHGGFCDVCQPILADAEREFRRSRRKGKRTPNPAASVPQEKNDNG